MKLEDYSGKKRLTMLRYGESGSGKSIGCSSVAALWGPAYIFEFDRRLNALHEFYKDKPEVLKNIECDTYESAEGVFKKLQEIDKSIADGNPKYATVIFDSWTSWEEMVLEKIIGDNPGKDRKKMFTDADAAKPQSTRGIISVPTLEDYGIHKSVQTRFILELTSLPINVIVIAHIQSKVDEVMGGREVGIQAVGSLWKTLPKYFDEVHRCFTDRGAYKVQVQTGGLYTCKTMLTNVPKDGIVDNTMERFSPYAFKLKGETK